MPDITRMVDVIFARPQRVLMKHSQHSARNTQRSWGKNDCKIHAKKVRVYSMKAPKITDYLSKEDQELSLTQGYIPAALKNKVVAQFKADKKAGKKATWNALFEAACRQYLAERNAENA